MALGAPCGDVGAPCEGGDERGVVLRDVVDEAEEVRLDRGDLVRRVQEARGRGGADERDEARDGAPRGRHAHAHLLEADSRAILGDAQVARERELGAAADRDAGDAPR